MQFTILPLNYNAAGTARFTANPFTAPETRRHFEWNEPPDPGLIILDIGTLRLSPLQILN